MIFTFLFFYFFSARSADALPPLHLQPRGQPPWTAPWLYHPKRYLCNIKNITKQIFPNSAQMKTKPRR